MEQNIDDKTIISRLFVSQETLKERLDSLVKLSQGIIQIAQESGDLIIEDTGILSHGEKIFLNLLGNYFAWKADLKENARISLGEIADKIGVPMTTIPSPMNTLTKTKVIIKSEKGLYQLNFENYKKVKETLQKIRNKVVHSGGENVS